MNTPSSSIQVRILQPGDAALLEEVVPEVFDKPVDSALSAEFRADPRHHLAVAVDGDTVVGMASAVHYIHPDKPAELWINEVGVAPDYQRQGIGRRLMRQLFELGRELGCVEAWVATEPDNQAARGLYANVGGASEPCVVYSFALSAGAAEAVEDAAAEVAAAEASPAKSSQPDR